MLASYSAIVQFNFEIHRKTSAEKPSAETEEITEKMSLIRQVYKLHLTIFQVFGFQVHVYICRVQQVLCLETKNI